MPVKKKEYIQINTVSAGKGTFDCVITFKEISVNFLIMFENEITNTINAQMKNLEGWIEITTATKDQLRSLNRLIELRDQIRNEITRNPS